jgi:hypothetical protein
MTEGASQPASRLALWLEMSLWALLGLLAIDMLFLGGGGAWRWPLFAWGATIAVTWALWYCLVAIAVGRSHINPGEPRRRVRRRFVRRARIWLVSGLFLAMRSAYTGVTWIDVAFTLVFAVMFMRWLVLTASRYAKLRSS